MIDTFRVKGNVIHWIWTAEGDWMKAKKKSTQIKWNNLLPYNVYQWEIYVTIDKNVKSETLQLNFDICARLECEIKSFLENWIVILLNARHASLNFFQLVSQWMRAYGRVHFVEKNFLFRFGEEKSL